MATPERIYPATPWCDTVAFEIDDGVVKLSRAKPRDLAYAEALEGTLSEWTSDADEQAYRVT